MTDLIAGDTQIIAPGQGHRQGEKVKKGSRYCLKDWPNSLFCVIHIVALIYRLYTVREVAVIPIILSVLASGQLLLLGWGLDQGRQIISDNPKEIRLPLPARIILSFSLVITALCISLSLRNLTGNLLLWGMIFSFIGDLFNAGVIPLKNPRIGGMLSFAPTQILYAAAFYSLLEAGMPLHSRIILAVFWLALITNWWFFIRNPEKIPALNLGSLIYSLLLGTMLCFALITALQLTGWWWMILAGAFLFFLSDTIIGLTDFGGLAMKKPHLWIWLTYIPAQMGILYGIWLGFNI